MGDDEFPTLKGKRIIAYKKRYVKEKTKKMKNFEEMVTKQVNDLRLDSENLLKAVVGLVDLAKRKGFAEEACATLSDCGIKLEIKEA